MPNYNIKNYVIVFYGFWAIRLVKFFTSFGTNDNMGFKEIKTLLPSIGIPRFKFF